MTTARKATDTDEEWVTLGSAARELGESRLSVLTRTVKGELTAKHIAGRTLISRESLNGFRSNTPISARTPGSSD